MANKKLTTKREPNKTQKRERDAEELAPCGAELGLDPPLMHYKKCLKCQRLFAETDQANHETKQLALFPELAKHMRALPTSIARSALFRVADKREPRKYIDPKHPQPIAALKGVEINYSGPELRQDDQDVMLELHRLCRGARTVEGVSFVPRQILTALKQNDQRENYRRLHLIMSYLSDGSVIVQTEREGFRGKLIRKFKWRDRKKHDPAFREYRVWLEPEIYRLFESYTEIDFEQRLMLKSALAKAIHSHLSTHNDPYPYRVDTWRRLTGSSTHSLRKFKQQLKIALAELVSVEFLQAWNITEDLLVHVVRAGKRQPQLQSGSQEPISE